MTLGDMLNDIPPTDRTMNLIAIIVDLAQGLMIVVMHREIDAKSL